MMDTELEEDEIVVIDDTGNAAVEGDTPTQGADEENGRRPPPQMIPKARFDEVNERMKRAEEQIAELVRQQREAVPSVVVAPHEDIAALSAQLTAALMDGDEALAADANARMSAALLAQAKRETMAEIEARTASISAQQKLDLAVTSALDQYPFLDDSGPDANLEAIAEVVEWRDYYHHIKKLPMHDAVTQAALRVAKTYGAAGGEDDKGSGSPDPRTARALARAAHVSANQPSAVAGVGSRADGGRVNVEALSDDEFKKLPDAEKRRLRGD